MVRPKSPRAALDGNTGATAIRAKGCGSNPSRHLASVKRRANASNARARTSRTNHGLRRDFTASELASVQTAGQDGIFGGHAHCTPHARLYRIGDSWDDPARE